MAMDERDLIPVLSTCSVVSSTSLHGQPAYLLLMKLDHARPPRVPREDPEDG